MAKAKLTAEKRRAIPAGKMGLPKLGKYPVDTPDRARNAKARAAQQFEKGNLSRAQLGEVAKKADTALGGSPAKKAKRESAAEIAKKATKRAGGTPKVKPQAMKPHPGMGKK